MTAISDLLRDYRHLKGRISLEHPINPNNIERLNSIVDKLKMNGYDTRGLRA